MTIDKENPYEALKKLFHEPNRLAIMSAICSAKNGLTFKELKDSCNLTDGNLNRHLKVLEEAEAIIIKKKFVGVKPRTTIYLSETGLKHFNDYLEALEEVLKQAQTAVASEAKDSHFFLGNKAVQ